MSKPITDFINGEVYYDDCGQYLFIKQPNGGVQMLGEIRGWGRIQQMFLENGKPKTDDWEQKATDFQDSVGRFIADAINEKLKKGGDDEG